MKMLYENRSLEDKEFIKKVCDYILSEPIKDKPESNEFAAIFVEGRNREINTLEDFASIYSFKRFSKYNYPVFCFINNDNNFLKRNLAFEKLADEIWKIKNRINIIKIPELNSLESYSKFCIEKLYFMLPKEIEHVITLQPDAMLIKEGYEDYLLDKHFNYLGAPWLHAPGIEYLNKENKWEPFLSRVRIGNGGMSYRKASFCRSASNYYRDFKLREMGREDSRPPMEDLLFSVISDKFSMNRPTIEEARKFAIDPMDEIDFNNKISYAFHYFCKNNPWKRLGN